MLSYPEGPVNQASCIVLGVGLQTAQCSVKPSESISRASALYASEPGEDGACCRMLRPLAGASAKRIDFRTGGSSTGSP